MKLGFLQKHHADVLPCNVVHQLLDFGFHLKIRFLMPRFYFLFEDQRIVLLDFIQIQLAIAVLHHGHICQPVEQLTPSDVGLGYVHL